jgi:hypothetical protein
MSQVAKYAPYTIISPDSPNEALFEGVEAAA